MLIKWLGHASFLITLDTGTKIITDPYEEGFAGIIEYGPIKEEADIVTVSHEHGDHNAVEGLPGSPEVVRGVGTHSVKGIDFVGTASFHDKAEGKERGPNTIFSFEADGLRLCHLGDLGHPLSDDQLGGLGNVDILFIPTGGPMAVFELEEAWELCDKLKPNIIIPMHFKTEKCSFPIYTVDDFIAGRDEARRVKDVQVEITTQNLPAKTEIMVLDYAL